MAHPRKSSQSIERSRGSVDRPVARRLVRVNLVSAVAFIFGGSLFALGAVFAQLGVGSPETVNITYLAGGFFFSLGGYVLIVLVVNANTAQRGPTSTTGLRLGSFQPHLSGWLSAAVLFVGTLLFAGSLVAAFAEFFLAGIAAFTRPATSRAVDIGLVNWGTFAGAVCFAIGGVIQVLNKPEPARGEVP